MLRCAVCVAWVLWISAKVIAIAFLLITKKQSHCESELTFAVPSLSSLTRVRSVSSSPYFQSLKNCYFK